MIGGEIIFRISIWHLDLEGQAHVFRFDADERYRKEPLVSKSNRALNGAPEGTVNQKGLVGNGNQQLSLGCSVLIDKI